MLSRSSDFQSLRFCEWITSPLGGEESWTGEGESLMEESASDWETGDYEEIKEIRETESKRDWEIK